jgi:5'-3' exonuclease
MGIHGLSKFIRDKFANAITCHHLSEFAYKIIAVDISVFLYKYSAINTKNRGISAEKNNQWLEMIVQLVGVLRKNNIHCIFIYDGKAPKEKEFTQKKRREDIRKREEKAEHLRQDLEILKTEGEMSAILKGFIEKRNKNYRKLLVGGYDIPTIEREVREYGERNTPEITENDILLTKRLFTILKIPFCTAPQEAEGMCSKLCIDNRVFGVLSEDTDIMVYGTPNFIFNIDVYNETCLIIENQALLTEMGFSRNQFVDFCIMCGTDYNTNIKGIGPAGAFKLISQYKTIENIMEKKGTDISILNHTRGRVLFNNPISKKIEIPYTGKPDYSKLEEFIDTNKIYISVEKVREYFTPNKLVIIEDSDEDLQEIVE